MMNADGNIYSEEDAKKLGLSFDEMIPLTEDETNRYYTRRSNQATRLRARKRNKAAKNQRRRNRK